jgi:hypothetical protein
MWWFFMITRERPEKKSLQRLLQFFSLPIESLLHQDLACIIIDEDASRSGLQR